jgi:hypothetical protein
LDTTTTLERTTSMSWNPRRFAAYINDVFGTSLSWQPEQILLWLSAEAIDRMGQDAYPAEAEWRMAIARNKNTWSEYDSQCAVPLNTSSGRRHGDQIFAPTFVHAENPKLKLMTAVEDIPESEALLIATLIRGAWTLYNEPEEVSAAAVTVERETVTIGKKRKARQQDIVVVDVRRRVREGSEPEPGEEERPAVEHDFRWPVRGHWRLQPCGTGRAERRKIWIDAYVAGPEDKPLKTRTRVSVVG